MFPGKKSVKCCCLIFRYLENWSVAMRSQLQSRRRRICFHHQKEKTRSGPVLYTWHGFLYCLSNLNLIFLFVVFEKAPSDADLKEHMVGIIFSRSKLTNLQKQVNVQLLLPSNHTSCFHASSSNQDASSRFVPTSCRPSVWRPHGWGRSGSTPSPARRMPTLSPAMTMPPLMPTASSSCPWSWLWVALMWADSTSLSSSRSCRICFPCYTRLLHVSKDR